ncbi:MAG: hypothetical protein HQK61_00225 [Desulfamplus sp.]|nr:hypothetical protein [Desulfamplus sp.]
MNDSLPKSVSPVNEQKTAKHENISSGDKESSPAIIFGLKDYPRPRNSGFFYCKPPSLFGNFSIKTLAVLDLYNTDRQYITQIITKGIECMLEDDEYANNKEYYLTNYETENMKPFVQTILKQVIESNLLLSL